MNTSSPYMVCIGGANMDTTGMACGIVQRGDSCVGSVDMCAGGVARNIAENFARVADKKCYLLCCVGADIYGDSVLSRTQKAGVDISLCTPLSEYATATYLSIIDNTGDMVCAINDMAIMEALTPDRIRGVHHILQGAELLCLDTNIPSETLRYTCETYHKIPLFIDTVSHSKVNRIAPLLAYIHTLKANKVEAEVLLQSPIKTEHDLQIAATFLHNKGLKTLFITLGVEGTYVSSIATGEQQTLHQPAHKGKIVNATGAGDAHMAGVVYGYMHNHTLTETVAIAQIMAFMTAQYSQTINPHITQNHLLQTLQS